MVNAKYLKLNPKDCLNMSFNQSLDLLKKIVDKKEIEKAFDISKNYPGFLEGQKDTTWSHNAKIMGINPRITKTFWGIVKYAMTFPEECVHIMPLWTPGIDGGFYAPLNFRLNKEFMDNELSAYGYDTPEKQLKLVINVLHAMGKVVCFDALLHTERWSELVFLYPQYFEWVKLNKTKSRQYSGYELDFNSIYKEVQICIKTFLQLNGCADTSFLTEKQITELFTDGSDVLYLDKILFGNDDNLRLERRKSLINFVRSAGFETIPVTEHAPSRPVVFDKIVQDSQGSHSEFKVENMSREAKIFGALTPFKLYRIDKDGYPLCDEPQEQVWSFISDIYADFQKEYNFDFMRADMAHNQQSHSHKKNEKIFCNQKEIWRFIKSRINEQKPYFAVLAEAFLNMDYYIDGYQDLQNKDFDIVLGDLNYLFLNHEYIYRLKTRNDNYYNYNFKICSTSFTNDSDRQENTIFYSSVMSCAIRYFTGLFCDSPSYCAIGYELKDFCKKEKEYFSSIYTNYQENAFKWGDNAELFVKISEIRSLYEKIAKEIKGARVFWLNSENDRHACWMYVDSKSKKPLYLFVINLDAGEFEQDITIRDFQNCVPRDKKYTFLPLLTLSQNKKKAPKTALKNNTVVLKGVETGEIRAYKIDTKSQISFLKNFKANKLKKQKRQILLIAPECAPYSKAGGMSDINRDFTEALKKKYPDFDLRIIIPIYNVRNTVSLNGFEIEDLNIKADYSYGLNKSYANLYKVKFPDNEVETYAVYSPAFSLMKEPYEGSEYNYGKQYIAYSSCVLALLKILAKKENFKPEILHLTDWPVGFVTHLLNDSCHKDKFYKNMKTVMTIHNTGYQGKYDTFYAFLNLFEKDFIKETLSACNIQISENTIKNALQDYDDFRLNNKDLCTKLNDYLEERLDSNYFDIDFVTKERFNTLLYAIKNSDAWLTDSESFYKELITNASYASTLLFETLYRNRNKGAGVTCGICEKRYDPCNCEQVKFPYSLYDANECKKKNKAFVQDFFANNNQGSNPDRKFLVSDSDEKRIFGSLNKDPDSVMIYNTSRFDISQKGIDLFIKVIKPILLADEHVQFVICIKGISKNRKYDYINELLKNCESHKLFKGRVVVIDDFVPVYTYMAASDILVMPSYFEPCGMVQMQAMRYGCIPVVSNTGGLRDTVCEKTGFKTDIPLLDAKYPQEFLLSALKQALKVYREQPENWNKMVKNCMQNNVGWDNFKIDGICDFYKKLL